MNGGLRAAKPLSTPHLLTPHPFREGGRGDGSTVRRNKCGKNIACRQFPYLTFLLHIRSLTRI